MTSNNWDSGVSYEESESRILKALTVNKKVPIRWVKCLIYAIQLRNGARISEATDALKEFYKCKQEVEVLVRKKKKQEFRPMLWPKSIKKPNFKNKQISEIVKKMTKKQAQDSCRKLIGMNSHSLRYARVTRLEAEGLDGTMIAKITHHSNPTFVMRYIQQRAADKKNREIE